MTNYLCFRGRDRMRLREVPCEHIVSITPPGLTVPTVPTVGGKAEVTLPNPMVAASFLTYMDYEVPLRGNDNGLWVAGSAYNQIPFGRRFSNNNRCVFLLLNKRDLCIYF
jgi:hypothetical protein